MPLHRAGHSRLCRVLAFVGLALLMAAPLVADPTATEPVREVIDLAPEDPAAWSFRYLGAPFVSIFRGPSYMYEPREIEIETTPAGGYLDLFYVRSGFQKRFEQAESPVHVLLPSRVEAGGRDAFTVRAFAEGYRQKTVTLRLSERFERIEIDLEPLPNTLDGVSHRYFAGRSSLTFLTPVALAFRVQEADDGYGLILNETAMSKEARAAVDAIHSPLIAEAYGQQLGEDLMVKLVLANPEERDAIEVRSQQQYNAPRDLYEFIIDLVPADSAVTRVSTALDALSAIEASDVAGCTLAFDDAMRAALDPGALARSLRPKGSFTDLYVRAAMRRLGEVSVDGVVDFTDGSKMRPSDPIELEMSIANAATAKGYLALLRSFVDRLEPDPAHRRSALKSLFAPEWSGARFDAAYDAALASEQACAAGA